MRMHPVLYAEDNQDDVFFMQVAFKKAAVLNPLLVTKDGGETMDYLAGAGQYADRQKYPLPSLLLLDLNLPVKTGFEVLQWMGDNSALKNMRVVVVSASGQQLDIDLARKMGILDYVIKPSNPTRLAEIVRERFGAWLGMPGASCRSSQSGSSRMGTSRLE